MRESTIENKLRIGIEQLGGKCWKWTSPGVIGVPDRIILLPGGIIRFAELKAPGKHERASQRFTHSVLRGLGFTVYATVDSPERVSAILAECKEVIAHGYGL